LDNAVQSGGDTEFLHRQATHADLLLEKNNANGETGYSLRGRAW